MRQRITGLLAAEAVQKTALQRLAVELAAVTAFAALTALGARVQFRLPGTLVPVTGQVFCVLLAGCVLGSRLGFVSQVQYLAAGVAGAPVFALGGGIGPLLGPTGGYLVGFPVAAFVVGAIAQRGQGRVWSLAACLCGVAAIYLFGATWYGVWRSLTGAGGGIIAVLHESVLPFIGVDAAKAVLVAVVAAPLRRRLSAI